MSRKVSQGSQTPEEKSKRTDLERELEREREQEQQTNEDWNVASTSPLILLSAEQPRESKDAQVGTDPIPKRRTTTARDRDATISGQRVLFASNRSSLRLTTSSDNYDQDEPLTTKTMKVYKKRHSKPNKAADESDNSIAAQNAAQHRERGSIATDISQDTDMPQSDETDMVQISDSSSLKFSSSGSFLVIDSDLNPNDFQQGLLPPNMRLASGLGFIYMAIPPDGGYGWVVLMLSFLAQIIVDGIVFCVGILLPQIAKEFNVGSGQVVLVGSIQIGCYFLGGAFSSALINRFGFRPVALAGVFISALSILAASFSPNLAVMILLYSVIGGPGLSMIWVSSQLIIGYYFERYRPVASGFSCSGAGVGIFIFSIANNVLVQRVGWRNTIRFHVILICLLVFVAVAYLEVAPTPVGVMHTTEHLSSSSSNEYYGNFYVHNFLGEDLSSKKSHNVLETYEPPKKKKGRLRRLVSFCCPCCAKPSHSSDEPTPSERSERNYVVRPDPIQRDDLFYTGPVDYAEPHNKEQFDGKELELLGTQRHLQRAAYGLRNIHDYDSTDDISDGDFVPDSDPLSHRQTAPTSPPRPPPYRRQKRRKMKKRHWLHTKIVRALNRLFDFHLLKIFEFRVLLASAFLYPMGFNIPFVYSKMRTTIPSEYALMIAPAIGASNFVIRILCGFAAYKLRSWTNYICGIGMMLGGIIVLVSAFYGSDLIWFQFVYGLCYGVAPAVFASLRALIYVRYLGLSKLTNAFGLTALAMGLGVFIGTTLGGVLLDQTGGFTVPFAFAGVCIMVSGVLKLILPTLIKIRDKRQRN